MQQPLSRKWLYYILLSLIVIAVFQLKFGLSVLLPAHDAWLYGWGSDMLPDICTWQYYRYSPLTQGALGVFKGYGYPQVTGVGNTNIVPLIGMPLKLFNRWLPEHFQYFGLFLFLCYLLQAWFADRLLAALKVPLGYWRFSAVIIVLLAAPFLDRFNHLALCAHWIVLASLVTFFSAGLSQIRASGRYAALSFAAVMIHPYLVLFPLMVASADGLQRILRKAKWITLFIFPLASMGGILVGAALSGIFSLGMGGSKADGFGIYSSNLNTFWNNIGKTNFSPLDLPTFFDGQYEGYAYLGLGVLVLWGTLLFQKPFYTSLFRVLRQYWPLFMVLILSYVYALAFSLTINRLHVFDPHLERYSTLYNTLSIFRSSGRYIWLPYYVLLIIPFVYYGHKLSDRRWTAALLFCIVILQLADMAKAIQRSIIHDNYKVNKEWSTLVKLSKEATTVYTYPLFQRHLLTPDDMQYMAGALAPLQIPVTAGHLPRPDAKRQQYMIDSLLQMRDAGEWLLATGGLLITTKEKAPYFTYLQDRKAIKIRNLGDYSIIYAKTNTHIDSISDQLGLLKDSIAAVRLDVFLEEHRNQTMIIVTADEASKSLQPFVRAGISRFSPVFSNIQAWEAYAAVWHHGKMLKEQKMPKDKDLEMNCSVAGKTVSLRATSGIQQEPYLRINGIVQQGLDRGVNIFVFDEDMQLTRHAIFDLYETCYSNR